MNSKFLLMLFATALTLAAPAAVTANEPAEQQQTSPARRMWEELNLTAEQEARFREISAKYAPARRDHTQRIQELRTRINNELMKDRPSRSLLAQYAGQMGEIQKRMNIASVEHMLEIKSVLSPEQFKIFVERSSIGSDGAPRRRPRRADTEPETDEQR